MMIHDDNVGPEAEALVAGTPGRRCVPGDKRSFAVLSGHVDTRDDVLSIQVDQRRVSSTGPRYMRSGSSGSSARALGSTVRNVVVDSSIVFSPWRSITGRSTLCFPSIRLSTLR